MRPPIPRVGGHPAGWRPSGEGTSQHPLGEDQLGREARALRDACFRSVPGVPGPAARQIERTVDECRALLRGIGQEDADLRVAGGPGRAGILARDPTRVRALLEEARLVDDEHATGPIPQGVHDIGAQVIAHALGIPNGRIEQALHTLRSGLADGFGELPPVLAFHAVEQAPQVPTDPLTHFRPCKAGRDARLDLGERLRPATENRQFVRWSSFWRHGAFPSFWQQQAVSCRWQPSGPHAARRSSGDAG